MTWHGKLVVTAVLGTEAFGVITISCDALRPNSRRVHQEHLSNIKTLTHSNSFQHGLYRVGFFFLAFGSKA